jgi:transposase InsO family protein
VLWHRARYGLSLDATARAFVVSVQTLVNWTREVRAGVTRLVTTRSPMNKLPDLVRELASLLKFEWPRWGTRRIAGILGRLGLKASRTSVQRMLRPKTPRPRKLARARKGQVVAKRPVHMFLVDFTRVGGFFRSVVVGAVLDAFSRRVMAVRVFAHEPDAADACALMRDACRHRRPRWLITDRGVQFASRKFARFLARFKIRRRFGAVGRPNSISRIERFWRSAKEEYLRGLLLWLPLRTLQLRVAAFARWYNAERPHRGSLFGHPTRRTSAGAGVRDAGSKRPFSPSASSTAIGVCPSCAFVQARSPALCRAALGILVALAVRLGTWVTPRNSSVSKIPTRFPLPRGALTAAVGRYTVSTSSRNNSYTQSTLGPYSPYNLSPFDFRHKLFE